MDIDTIFSNLEKADKIGNDYVVFGTFRVTFDRYTIYIYENELLLQSTDISNETYIILCNKCLNEINRRKGERLKEFELELKKIKG